ncbi:MAG: carbohydrate-binding protein [Bacteroidales bacterium]|nr:carbohydrate-binding protein [Bacteroidales bacterium]
MKRLLLNLWPMPLWLLAFGLSTGNLSAQCYVSIGYQPSWVGSAASIDYSKWTHINYAFAIPNTNGTIGSIENAPLLIDLVSRAHANNTKVLLSVGGWLSSSPNNTPFESIANSSAAINTFVEACAALVNQYNLDGIDIDWEYPTSQTKWNNLMVPLGNRIHGMNKLLTAAVAGGAYSGDNFGNLSMLDLVNIMAYDCNCPTNAPYSYAVSGLEYWAGRGVPKEKRILGLPFYSSDNYTSLHVQKTNLAKANGGGIMVWDIATQYGDITSIVNTLGTLCKGTSNCTTINLPATLQAENYCSMSGIQTETTSDAGGGLNVGWIDANDWIAYRVNVPSTGTYTVQYRVASQNGGGSIRIEKLGGGTTYGSISVPSTGGWQTWTTISHNVTLTAGVQDIAITAPAGGYNINWFSISGGTVPFNLTVQAESYNMMSGIQTETTSDAGGGLNVGWIDANDWMLYNNINIPSNGTYTLQYRVASQNGGGSLQFERGGGSPVFGSINVPSTGGWQTWTTISHTVSLTAGNQSFGIKALGGGWNLNWFAITNSAPKSSIDASLENSEGYSIDIYPTKVNDVLIIDNYLNGHSTYRIFNSSGNCIAQNILDEGTNTIDVSSFEPGFYLIQIVNGAFIKNEKIIK